MPRFLTKQRRPLTPSEQHSADRAFQFATNSLYALPQTEAELQRRMRDRGFSQPAIEAAIQRCLEYCYLDDTKFAQVRAQTWSQTGKKIGHVAQRALQQKGVPNEIAKRVIDDAESEVDLPTLLCSLWRRKFTKLTLTCLEPKEYQRVVRFALSRGYSFTHINQAFQRLKDDADA